MSKKDYTHLIIILDRSGSMSNVRVDMQGGFDAFVKDQQELEGEATLTLAQFDTDYDIVHDNIAIANVPNLNLVPRGGTALLDALGRTMNTERERILEMDADDKPEKIICVVITDGYENSSHEYNRKQIFDMIDDLENEEDPQWDFVFLGANQDAIAEGGSMGVRATKSITYDASSEGTSMAFKSLSKNMSSYRCSEKGVEYTFDDDDRKAQEELLKEKVDGKFNQAIPSRISDLK